MRITSSRSARRRGLLTLGVLTASSALLLTACGGSSSTAGSGSGGGGGKVGVSLITKDSTNPFFVAMQKGAKADAAKDGVDLTIAAGKQDGDEAGQVTAIENAVAKGQKGILITPNGPGVNSAIEAARKAGLFVIALDTPPDPPSTVDITFATDNFEAGKLIGAWAGKTLGGKPATIAMLDLFNDKIVSVDYNRDQGFLTGMGIDVKDAKKNGDEAKTGSYSGGSYTIVCNEPTGGAEDGGRTAMERCLAKNPAINVVYTINEPSANGAYAVKDGTIGATSQQYPLKMATLGMEAIAKFAKDGTKPTTSDGLDFFNTGVALVTDKPADGVTSITTDEGSKICWG